MIRQHENSVAFKAGMLSFGVHAILIIAMLVSFSWHTPQPVSIAEVELWENLPVAPTVVPPKPLPEPVVEKEVPKPPPKPEPEPEPKPEIKEEPKADIQLEKKRQEVEKRKEEEKKKAAELEKLKKQMLLEEKLEKQKLLKEQKQQQLEKERQEALSKLQQEMLADDAKAPKASGAKSSSAASAGEVDKYKAMIQAKIQRNVNKSLCGDGNPELIFDITVMPTGEVQGSPNLIKSSSLTACDDAVERAILQSQPLPLPADPDLRAEFRNLRLKFRPNE
jgi:colicin import membrane protein